MPSKKRNRFTLGDALAEAAGTAPEERPDSPQDARGESSTPDTGRSRRSAGAQERGGHAGESGFEKKPDGGYQRADGTRIKKTSLLLEERQVRELKARAAAAGVSVSEYVAQQLDL